MFRAEFLARCSLAAGVRVTGDMIDHCTRAGFISRPEKYGGRYRYDNRQVQEMLDHIIRRGRQVLPKAKLLIAKAARILGEKHEIAAPEQKTGGQQ